jgi:hypothetical protein
VTVRALAFGNPDGSLWAAGLDAGAPALIAGGATDPFASAVEWTVDGAEWTLRAEGVRLTVVPTPEPEREPVPDGAESPEDPPAPPWEGRQELCRVTGTLSGVTIEATGVRTVLERIRPGELGTVRAVNGWMSAEEAVTLLALRPRSESHHEDDLVAATVFDPEGWSPSLDPRLSTTYDGGGEPTRATLELWISDGERELPRRVAGEATGPAVRLAAEGRTLEVRPLRCHSRGHDGAGVYLLARL